MHIGRVFITKQLMIFNHVKKEKNKENRKKRNPCRKYSPQRLEIVRNFGFLLKKAESADNPKKSAKKLY